ncbi:MAG TPA: arginine deiminase-related protein [Gammaproteobacteria bacterium]|nr:arginine deiminase-related protein [Gammaproteobacteria bacterium]
MIRPSHFAANSETAASNRFQSSARTDRDVAARAAREFDGLAVLLAAAGVRVHAFAGARDAELPDEVFPNNWVSFHEDGTAVLYPLLAPNRRRERRPELIDALRDQHGYRVTRIVDLTALEQKRQYLEGTGSVVLDRANRIAYACRSARTHDEALAELGRALGYEPRPFDATDRDGHAVYHTNVLLSIGTRFAVFCSSAVRDETDRRRILARLAEHREVIDLSFEQLHSFAGNLLELRAGDAPVIALSAAALASLRRPQRRALEAHGELVAADVGTIERHGGGSVRCMLAEVALPRA